MNAKQKQKIVKSICFSIMKTSFSYLNTDFIMTKHGIAGYRLMQMVCGNLKKQYWHIYGA